MTETFVIKGEQHYVWPMTLYNVNTTKCGQCLYYRAHPKPSTYWDGECTSVVRNTERGYTHRTNGNDYTSRNASACRWFFLPQDETGQMKLDI